jgi:hypothetical protein
MREVVKPDAGRNFGYGQIGFFQQLLCFPDSDGMNVIRTYIGMSGSQEQEIDSDMLHTDVVASRLHIGFEG